MVRLHADLEEMVSRDPRLLVMATTKDHPAPEARAKEIILQETITNPTNVDQMTRDILPENLEEEATLTKTTGNQEEIVPKDQEVSIVVAKTEAIVATVEAKAITRAVKTTVVVASTVQEVATQLPKNDFCSEAL